MPSARETEEVMYDRVRRLLAQSALNLGLTKLL